MNFKDYLTENKELLTEAMAEDLAKKLKKHLVSMKSISEDVGALAKTTFPGEKGESDPVEVLKHFEKSEKITGSGVF